MSAPIHDTPIKVSSVSVTATAVPTLAGEVMDAVKRDLDRAICLTSKEFFLQQILGITGNVSEPNAPLSSQLEQVIRECYDGEEKRWHDFPRAGEPEEKFYKPFVALANKIHDAAIRSFPTGRLPKNVVNGKWVDCHSTAPTANTDFVAEIRPDCGFVTNHQEVTKSISEYDNEMEPSSEKEPVPKNDKESKTKEKAKKLHEVWWSQMVVPLEAKKVFAKKSKAKAKAETEAETPTGPAVATTSNDPEETLPDMAKQSTHYIGAVPQLLTYIRQIFRQQLDRRFALGITISFRNIAIWLCDHSGVLGMSEVIDFHKYPRDFIQIISAISLLPSYKLGYDPNMKLYDPRIEQYHFSHKTQGPPQRLDRSRWLLKITDPRLGPNGETMDIVLAEKPMLARTAEVMNGRAQQIHSAYLQSQWNTHYRHPLVVKMSWQPDAKVFNDISIEAYFYNLIPRFRKRLLASSVVKASDGWDGDGVDYFVSTMRYIRANAQIIVDEAKKLNIKMTDSGTTKLLNESDEPMAYMAFGNFKSSGDNKKCAFFAENPELLTDRIQTRIALNIWGWPMVYFTTLDELLTVIADVIKDHQAMIKARVLHRDLSHGNILIRPQSPRRGETVENLVSKETRGVLIDLDHAKRADQVKTVMNQTPSSDKVRRITDFLITENGLSLAKSVAEQAMMLVPSDDDRFVPYVRQAIRFNVLELPCSVESTAANLGWNQAVEEQPNFESRLADAVRRRTGTLPYISHRLMTRKPDVHNAIHDMESLFWVVIWICLTRQSGGGHRWLDAPDETVTLVKDLFDADAKSITQEKGLYFREYADETFEELLMKIHPYFNPLKEMLRRWHKVLLLGYDFKAYEYHLVHDYLLKIVNDTRLTSDVEGEQVTTVIRETIQNRVKEYSEICNIPLTSSAGNPTQPTTSAPLASVIPQPQAASSSTAANRSPTVTADPPAQRHPRASVAPMASPARAPYNTPPQASSSTLNRAPTPPASAYHQAPSPPKMPAPKKARKD